MIKNISILFSFFFFGRWRSSIRRQPNDGTQFADEKMHSAYIGWKKWREKVKRCQEMRTTVWGEFTNLRWGERDEGILGTALNDPSIDFLPSSWLLFCSAFQPKTVWQTDGGSSSSQFNSGLRNSVGFESMRYALYVCGAGSYSNDEKGWAGSQEMRFISPDSNSIVSYWPPSSRIRPLSSLSLTLSLGLWSSMLLLLIALSGPTENEGTSLLRAR